MSKKWFAIIAVAIVLLAVLFGGQLVGVLEHWLLSLHGQH